MQFKLKDLDKQIFHLQLYKLISQIVKSYDKTLNQIYETF